MPRMFRLIVLVCCAAVPTAAQPTQVLSIRGHQQTLRMYGVRGGRPVIVSSGDGGWIHLGPHVAELLAANGYFVVGFDAKAYHVIAWGKAQGSSTRHGNRVISPILAACGCR